MAAILLLLLEEEDAFWLLCAIVEDLLPASYYTPSLLGTKENGSFELSIVTFHFDWQASRQISEFSVNCW